MNKETLKVEAQIFLKKVFTEFDSKNFSLESHWHIDHLCYRTATQEMYLRTKAEFETFSKLLIESEVNGRMISTFKLKEAIVFNGWSIDLIEVPAPKMGKLVKDGFEHLEVVCDLGFDEIKDRYQTYDFDESGLAKDFNQELEIVFSDFAIKFHHLSLESVINVESNTALFAALKETKVLKLLKKHNPIIAGTYPLNLNIENSDVDILIYENDLESLKRHLVELFSHHQKFKLEMTTVDGDEAVIANFYVNGLKFEIFGQKIDSVQQKAYLHFLAEERLLKLGGEGLLNKVREYKIQGLKTEPAFAKALIRSGDAYNELLLLQKKGNDELISIVKNSQKDAL
jgi:predicted metalloenzyme YecM